MLNFDNHYPSFFLNFIFRLLYFGIPLVKSKQSAFVNMCLKLSLHFDLEIGPG